MLGHSSITITADTYTSLLPEAGAGGTQGRPGLRWPCGVSQESVGTH
jgi:hypothetical protein